MAFDPDEWGTVADWVAAIGSAGALLAAVHLIRQETLQRRLEKADRDWAQARLVSITSSSAGGGFRGFDEAGEPIDVGPYSYDATGTVDNSSTMPLHNLQIDVYVGEVPVRRLQQAVLLPGRRCEAKGRLGNVAEPDLQARATVSFTDAAGLDWTLATDAPLRRHAD